MGGDSRTEGYPEPILRDRKRTRPAVRLRLPLRGLRA